jgi:hypothetical protein
LCQLIGVADSSFRTRPSPDHLIFKNCGITHGGRLPRHKPHGIA